MCELTRMKYEIACVQHGISLKQGREWIQKVRMFIDDDKTGLLNDIESVAGSPAQPCEEIEMVPALSGR